MSKLKSKSTKFKVDKKIIIESLIPEIEALEIKVTTTHLKRPKLSQHFLAFERDEIVKQEIMQLMADLCYIDYFQIHLGPLTSG